MNTISEKNGSWRLGLLCAASAVFCQGCLTAQLACMSGSYIERNARSISTVSALSDILVLGPSAGVPPTFAIPADSDLDRCILAFCGGVAGAGLGWLLFAPVDNHIAKKLFPEKYGRFVRGLEKPR